MLHRVGVLLPAGTPCAITMGGCLGGGVHVPAAVHMHGSCMPCPDPRTLLSVNKTPGGQGVGGLMLGVIGHGCVPSSQGDTKMLGMCM